MEALAAGVGGKVRRRRRRRRRRNDDEQKETRQPPRSPLTAPTRAAKAERQERASAAAASAPPVFPSSRSRRRPFARPRRPADLLSQQQRAKVAALANAALLEAAGRRAPRLPSGGRCWCGRRPKLGSAVRQVSSRCKTRRRSAGGWKSVASFLVFCFRFLASLRLGLLVSS